MTTQNTSNITEEMELEIDQAKKISEMSLEEVVKFLEDNVEQGKALSKPFLSHQRLNLAAVFTFWKEKVKRVFNNAEVEEVAQIITFDVKNDPNNAETFLLNLQKELTKFGAQVKRIVIDKSRLQVILLISK